MGNKNVVAAFRFSGFPSINTLRPNYKI